MAETKNTDLLPTNTGLDLGSPSQRWDLYGQNLDISGTITLSSQAISTSGGITSSAAVTGLTLVATATTGTAPLTISSTTKVANLNADLLDNGDWGTPGSIGVTIANAGAFTTISASGQITSTLAAGTAPFVIASTDKVVNLNADQLDGSDWAIPASIGSTTPNAGAFTTLSASTSATITIADSLTVGGKIIPQTWTVEFYLFGTMVDAHMWIAPRACKVVSVKEIHSVVGGASAAVRPRKITDTSAPGAVASATVKEITTAAADLTAIINTTQTLSLSATASDYTFAANDKLSLDMSGTVAATVGIIVVEFQAV
jgi:hypothetical protein